ncbi:MAG: hypothetical protein WC644_01835 [Ignavibacteria bacterium]
MKTLKDKLILDKLTFLANIHRVPATIFTDEDSMKQFKCPESALKFFLKYAFERSGSAPAFKYMAKEALEKAIDNFNENRDFKEKDFKNLWKEFRKLKEKNNLIGSSNKKYDGDEKDKGLNRERNLFYNKGICEKNRKCSVLQILQILKKEASTNNLSSWCSSKLENNEIKIAYNKLLKIRGIGPKIASLYLRDIAYLKGIRYDKQNDFSLLMPIDTWIAQAYKIIFNKKESTTELIKLEKDRKRIQDEIVKICCDNDICPIEFNKGAWYFGSKIAKTYDRFQMALEDDSKANEFIREAFTLLEKEKSALSKFL